MLEQIPLKLLQEILSLEGEKTLKLGYFEYGKFLSQDYISAFVGSKQKLYYTYYITDINNKYLDSLDSVLPCKVIKGHAACGAYGLSTRQEAYRILSSYIETAYPHLAILHCL